MDAKVEVSTNDVVRSGAVLGAVIAALGMLATGFAGFPGFVWACLAGLCAATCEFVRKQGGKLPPGMQQDSLSKQYVVGALIAVGIAFVMPALIPADAYAVSETLRWINGVLLLGGLMAVPLAHAQLRVARMLAVRRLRK